MPREKVQVVIGIICAALALSACSEWPPQISEIRGNLFENRETFERLEAELDESGFGLIRGTGLESIMVGFEAEGEIEYDNIEDKKGWGKLLSTAKVMDISRNEDVYFFTIGDTGYKGSYVFMQYIHHPDADSELKVCLPSHREVGCGECVEKLDTAWWAYYKWFPSRISENDLDALMEGKITQEEYDQRSEEAIDNCWRDGYAEMGYEIAEESAQ